MKKYLTAAVLCLGLFVVAGCDNGTKPTTTGTATHSTTGTTTTTSAAASTTTPAPVTSGAK